MSKSLANQTGSDLYSIPHRSIPEKSTLHPSPLADVHRAEQQFSSIFLAFTLFSCILGRDVTPTGFLFSTTLYGTGQKSPAARQNRSTMKT
ncbi:MAG TPA: hypothetical protein VK857_13230, partial [Desulforhopalus sp.]|nr:hypothetical protein [Desulforhopalus sp.]